MALKAILLRKKIDEKKSELKALREKDEEFERREAELLEAIEEASGEDLAQVEEEAETFSTEKEEHENAKTGLENEIGDLERELSEEEERTKPKGKPIEERKGGNVMVVRTKFRNMSMQERDAFFANEEVKDFLSRTRELGKQKRAINGAELLIPEIVLDLIKEDINKYSKLIKHVKPKPVPGKARQNTMGAIPEAVWTEMCATLNELSLAFNQTEVDGYKVGGYIAICNATLEDSDIALASEIIDALGQAIGYALDKAIVYGAGTKMPLGFVTRLAQKEAPSDYPASARPWEDLSTSNILTIPAAESTGIKLYQRIIKASGAAKSRKSAGNKFWAMNEKTHTTLLAEALSFNAAGAIVSGQNMTMPVIGGPIELLDFVPDDNIVGGYGDRYLLAERAGTSIAQSEHVRFIEDQTVYKGTARYDGHPVFAESFVAIGISGTAPTTTMDFTEDVANQTPSPVKEGAGE